LISLIIISLMYGKAIEKTRLAEILVALLSSQGFTAMLLIPLAIVFATGFEFTFVALGFPALKGLIQIDPNYITIGFLGGFIGSMLSPAHACLVMSSKYFKAELPRVYKYTVPASILTLVITLVLITFFH